MSKEAHERFTKIHAHYDFFNHLFSAGMDILWRDAAANDAMMSKSSFSVLDIATGTGDLAFAISQKAQGRSKKVEIVGTDFNKLMLDHAEEKACKMGITNIKFKLGEADNIKYPNKSFDVVTSGFAMRSFDDIALFSEELKRVLKPGGKIVMLDMARPDDPFNRTFMRFYFKIMNLISGRVNPVPYHWLTKSIWENDKKALVQTFKKHGFKDAKYRNLISGVAFIITGTKSD